MRATSASTSSSLNLLPLSLNVRRQCDSLFQSIFRLLIVGMVFSVSAVVPTQANAQQFLAPGYYGLMGENSVYHLGELRDAERALRNLYTGAYREGNVRWIDSSAYLALQGEIRFQMGDYNGAVTSFDDAILIYLNMLNWPGRVDWASQQAPQIDNNALRTARITWGQPARATRIGRFATNYQVRFGQDIIIQGQQGNARIPQERLRPADVFEICRAMALAIRRRDQILGPLSTVDETSRLLRSQLAEARNSSNFAVPLTLHSIMYGIAVAGEGDFKKSSEILQGHLQIDGLDHPLTPVALLQIGYNQYMSGDYRTAKTTLGEASFSAAIFSQFDVFRESLVLAAKAHTAVDRDQPIPELGLASEWARLHGLKMAQAQFAMVSAENDIENGNVEAAIVALESASSAMKTTTLAKSAQAARLSLLAEIATVISGKNSDILGLRQSLERYRLLTLWWYRVEYLRSPNKRRNLTVATLSTLVKAIARDPLADDWERDPIDTLAFLTGNRSDFVMSDLDLLISKRNYADALLTSELIRRMEFLYQLPLGGRLMSLRELVIRGPAELTPDLQRRQLEVRSRFNGFQNIMDDNEQLRRQLNQMPVNPAGEQQRNWLALVQQWQARNLEMERGFVNLSVRREALPLLFPPEVDLERTQQAIPEKSICLVIKQSGMVYHVFLVTTDKIVFQSSVNAGAVAKAIRGIAKMWGHTNANAIIQTEVVEDNDWKSLSNSTLMALVPKSTPEFWNSFDELVVVPDGQFWYLPFETLALESKPESEMLIDKLAVRYAPTLSLAFGNQSPRRLERVAFYPGKIDLKDGDQEQEKYANDFVAAWPKSMSITASELTPDQMGPLVDSMVMWNEVRGTGWPAEQERPKKNELYRALNLDAWPYLPNNGPDLFVFAGANTAMAEGVRKKTDTGYEIGYYATLMMAAGCKSMVLPRWRSGGNIPYQFQIELANELQQNQPTATAMRNAMLKTRQMELDPANQPRLRMNKQTETLKADHPFFWASSMVIDRGQWYESGAEQAGDDKLLLKAGGAEPTEEKEEAADKTEKEPNSEVAKPSDGKPSDGKSEKTGESTKSQSPGGEPQTRPESKSAATTE